MDFLLHLHLISTRREALNISFIHRDKPRKKN